MHQIISKGTTKTSPTAGLMVLMAVCVAIYINGLFGGFLFDDYENIVNNRAIANIDGSPQRWLVVAASSDSGMLKRPVSMLTFGLNHYLFGMSPIAFKVVNLFIHLLCGILVYSLSRRLLSSLLTIRYQTGGDNNNNIIALMISALWLLHPLHVSDVVYIVQRMNQLSALFTLAGLSLYAEGRLRMLRGRPGFAIAILSLLTFGTLAAFSKENGALIFLYALVIEGTCFNFRDKNGSLSKNITTLFLLLVALPGILAIIFIATNPDWLLKGYNTRDFTLMERVLTEPRILLHYILWIFIPLPSLMGLYHDDIPISEGLINPPMTLAAILFLTAACYFAWKNRRTRPSIAFAIGWFLVGHSMESTVIPLEIVFEHRNYLPMAGLLIGVGALAANTTFHSRNPRLTLAICLAMLTLLAGATAQRNYSWRSPISLALDSARNHPNSPRSLYEAGRAVMFAASQGSDAEKLYAKIEARSYFKRAMAIDKADPHAAIAHTLTFIDQQAFITSDTVSDLTNRLRTMPRFKAPPVLRLLDTVAQGRVMMRHHDVERIFEASMDNPSIKSYQKAMMLNGYGRYHFQALGDTQAAISLTLAAAAQEPKSPLFQVNLAKLAIALKQPALALQHAQNAKKMDHADIFSSEIEAAHQEIEKLNRTLQ